MKTAYLSLGSNLGDRRRYLREALRLLESPQLEVSRVSSVYETEAVGATRQPLFLNLVAEIRTLLYPLQLLRRTSSIETRLGRRRLAALAPRTIDIDILLYENVVMSTPRLTIPHPRMAERRFVLEPLAELAPGLLHPVLQSSIRDLLPATARQVVRRLAEPL